MELGGNSWGIGRVGRSRLLISCILLHDLLWKSMEPAITAIGNAVPLHRQSQLNIFNSMVTRLGLNRAEERILKRIYKEAGIEYRHSVLEDFGAGSQCILFPEAGDFPNTQKRMKVYRDNALPLAISAVDDCFSSLNNFDVNTITHLITISCTGMSAPGLDIELVQHLKLSNSTQRTTINFMGCYGVFNGLKVARSICQGDQKAKVLLVSVEMCTLHFQKATSLDNLISSTIFSDGAAAALIEGGPSQDQSLILRDFYCDLVPESQHEMTWGIGDQGFDIGLSSYVPHLIEAGIGAFVKRLLLRQSFEFAAIDYFAIHPGAKKILEACENALNIEPSSNRFSYEVLSNYGNMSSATILFVLKKIWESVDKTSHNKNIFSCAFGPGLTLESMILNLNYA